MSDIKKIEDQQEEMRRAGANAPAPAPSTQHAAAAVETVKSIKDQVYVMRQYCTWRGMAKAERVNYARTFT